MRRCPRPAVGSDTSAATKLSRGTAVTPLRGRTSVIVGWPELGVPDLISKLSKVTVTGAPVLRVKARMPVRLVELKNAVCSRR